MATKIQRSSSRSSS